MSGGWPSALAVSPATLAAQLERLRRRGYVGMTFAGAEAARRAGRLPPRTAVVTFDDGYASTLAGKEVLDGLGWPATVFVVTSFAESEAPLRWPGIDEWLGGPHAHELLPLGWDRLRSLAGAGWEIGSHTVTHPRLPALADAELRHELEQSRAAIAARVGECSTIAYPYGAYDARVAAAARDAGYLAAGTLPVALRPDRPHERPRVGLYERDRGLRLWLKTGGPPLRLRRSRLAGALDRG